MWSELPDKGWKLEASIVCWIRICKTGTIVLQPGYCRLHSACSSGGPCAHSGGQGEKALISSWDITWNCHCPFKCAQDNSLWSPAQMLQTMSFSAVVWSQSHLSSHSLINNFIVCNKSCYCYQKCMWDNLYTMVLCDPCLSALEVSWLRTI